MEDILTQQFTELDPDIVLEYGEEELTALAAEIPEPTEADLGQLTQPISEGLDVIRNYMVSLESTDPKQAGYLKVLIDGLHSVVDIVINAASMAKLNRTEFNKKLEYAFLQTIKFIVTEFAQIVEHKNNPTEIDFIENNSAYVKRLKEENRRMLNYLRILSPKLASVAGVLKHDVTTAINGLDVYYFIDFTPWDNLVTNLSTVAKQLFDPSGVTMGDYLYRYKNLYEITSNQPEAKFSPELGAMINTLVINATKELEILQKKTKSKESLSINFKPISATECRITLKNNFLLDSPNKLEVVRAVMNRYKTEQGELTHGLEQVVHKLGGDCEITVEQSNDRKDVGEFTIELRVNLTHNTTGELEGVMVSFPT